MTKLSKSVAVALLLASPALAQQKPLTANQLPKSGVISYSGTFTSIDFTAPMAVTVDFGTGAVSADITVPQLGSDNSISPPQEFKPTGMLDIDGDFVAVPTIFIGGGGIIQGNFYGHGAGTVAGTIITQFCAPDCGLIRTRGGSFTAQQ
jgi:hypothetical protein